MDDFVYYNQRNIGIRIKSSPLWRWRTRYADSYTSEWIYKVCATPINIAYRAYTNHTITPRAYASTFCMSDGSSIVDSDVKDMEHMDAAFHYMKTLMTAVGARRVSSCLILCCAIYIFSNNCACRLMFTDKTTLKLDTL